MLDLSSLLDAVDPRSFALALGLTLGRESRRDRVRILCPWHSEKHPSCDVTTRDGRLVAVCRSCGEGGDALSIAAAVWGLDLSSQFREVATRLADVLGVSLDDERRWVPRREMSRIEKVARYIDAMADDYLADRPLSADDVAMVESWSPEDVYQAFRLLREEDAARSAERATLDGELDRLADEFETLEAERWAEESWRGPV